MPLPPAFLDELRARTPLAPLIGRRARLTRNGRQWKGCCPFHNEKTPSFHVYDDHFHCFGCGAHGDAITFVMRADGASFPEAVERLAGEAGLEVPKPSPQAAARERRARDLHGVLAAAEALFQELLRAAEGRPALDYLRGRGLTDATIARFGLGWSGPGRGALAAALREREGIEPAQLAEVGLLKAREGGGWTDMVFDRVTFPIRDRRGRSIGWGGRTLGDAQPKYLNGPETALFRKRECLYALDLAREGAFRGAPVLVVEGYMDVIALHQAGLDGAVAPLGTALTEAQLEAIWALSPEPVLCFDGDAAGGRAAARAVETALPLLRAERGLKLAALPAGEDPDTLVRARGGASMRALLDGARRVEDGLLDLARERTGDATPHQRAQLLAECDRLSGLVPDRALAGEFRRHLRTGFFARYRGNQLGAAARAPSRPSIDPAGVRSDRARCLLAILLRHPALLPELEEALASLALPPPHADRLGAGLLAAIAADAVVDSPTLLAHLAAMGLAGCAAWAVGAAGLPAAASPSAQPADALEGFWHFFGLLRGEAALTDALAEAQATLVARNDDAAQRRLISLGQALASLRGGGDLAEANAT